MLDFARGSIVAAARSPFVKRMLIRPLKTFFPKLYPAARSFILYRLFSPLKVPDEWIFSRGAGAPPFKPLVSVIVPNYNHAPFLKERLDSVYAQDYGRFEVILLDDKSSDGSVEILERYANRRKERTRCVFNEANSGSPFAQWRKGLQAARGELVWIAESDDFCDPGFLSSLVPFFEDEAVMLAYCRSVFVKDGKRVWTLEDYLAEFGHDRWLSPFVQTAHKEVNETFAFKNVIPNVSSAVFRRPDGLELLEDPVWNRMKVCGDWVLYLHLIRGGALAYTPAACNYYRQHDGNSSVLAQRRDVYYKEHQIVAEHVARLYKVPEAVFDSLRERLLAFWRANRADEAPGRFDECYDLKAIKAAARERKPNVLMFGYALVSGGGETLPIFLANGMRAAKFGVTFVDCGMAPRNEGIRRMLSPLVPLVSLNGSYKFVEKAKLLGAEALHSHHGSVDNAISVFKRAYLPECVQVVSTHGMYESMSDGDLKRNLPGLMASVDRWFFTAEKNLEPFKRHGCYDQSRFRKATNGLLRSRIAPAERADLKLPGDAFVFCLVSRGIPEKGWEEAIAATVLARDRSKLDVRLVIIGDGDELERLRPSAPPCVSFLGFRPNIRDYFAMADMALLPSRFQGESFPLVLIDALFAGRPVLASDVGEIKSMLSLPDGKLAGSVFPLEGWTIPLERLASEMARCASDKGFYAEMSSNVQAAAAKFGIEAVVAEYGRHYEELLRGRRA